MATKQRIFSLMLLFIGVSYAANGSPSKLNRYELTMEMGYPSIVHDVSVTVFWNNEVYETTIYDSTNTNKFVFLAVETFSYNDYNTDSPKDKAKVLIQNNKNSDAAVFTSVKLILDDNSFYGAESFCADPNVVGSYYQNLITNDGNKCPVGLAKYDSVCVTHTPEITCNPANLMIYLDKRYPNQLIDTALIADAGRLFSEGCQMVVTSNNARKCARKDKATCSRTNFCTLVTYEVGDAIYPASYDLAKSKIFSIQYQSGQASITQIVLIVLIGISLCVNFYFYCGGCKRDPKWNATEITPLLPNVNV
eukprot:473430_1